MNINIDKIKELISESSNVVIMAHKNIDLDALGASLGVYYICKSLDKTAYLLIEDKAFERGVSRAFRELNDQKIIVNINTLSELKEVIDDKTLLIILDTNIINLTQNNEIFDIIENTILIDHHIMDSGSIKHITYQYVDINKSSACEMVVDLLESLNIYVHPYIATVLLTGIMIDTNNFFKKVTHGTYEAAAYLNKAGAKSEDFQYLLKQDLDRYIDRQQIISTSKIYDNKYAIGKGLEDKIYKKEDIAKVSDTLLLFNDIEAAFTIAKIDSDTIDISARSLGSVDVGLVMQLLGGGGHKTDAATQLNNISIDEGERKLLEIINKIK